MAALLNQDLLKLDVAATGERFWRWWTNELRVLWDGSWLHKLSRDVEIPMVTLGSDGTLIEATKIEPPGGLEKWLETTILTRFPILLSVFGQGALSRPVVLEVPEPNFLKAQLDLPAVTARILPNLLKFEIERHTPLALSDTLFGYRIVGRDRLTNRMSVELFVAKLRLLNRAVEAAQDRGLRVVQIRARTQDGAKIPMPILGGKSAALSFDHQNRTKFILPLILMALIGACAWAYSDRETVVAAALQDQLDTAQREAMAIESLSRKQAAVDRDLDALRARKQTESLTPILESVARVLPDGTWITGLQVEGDDISFSGFSNAAFKLPSVFDSSGVFTKSHLLGAVERQSSDPADRFDLATEYVGASRPRSPQEEK